MSINSHPRSTVGTVLCPPRFKVPPDKFAPTRRKYGIVNDLDVKYGRVRVEELSWGIRKGVHDRDNHTLLPYCSDVRPVYRTCHQMGSILPTALKLFGGRNGGTIARFQQLDPRGVLS